MSAALGVAISALTLGILGYFAYSLTWFLFVGRREESQRRVAVTSLGYVAVLLSAGLWFWGLGRFAFDVDWYWKARLLVWIGVTLCVVAIVAAHFYPRRASLPILLAALVVALNWIGSIVRD